MKQFAHGSCNSFPLFNPLLRMKKYNPSYSLDELWVENFTFLLDIIIGLKIMSCSAKPRTNILKEKKTRKKRIRNH